MAEPTERLIIGAMSGTSADGVDVALVRVTGRGVDMGAKLVAHRHTPYTDELRRLIFSMRGADAAVQLADLARCAREVSRAYADAVNGVLQTTGIAAEQIAAVDAGNRDVDAVGAGAAHRAGDQSSGGGGRVGHGSQCNR